MKVIDVREVKISEKTVCEYTLLLEGDSYSIKCRELNASRPVGDSATVNDITTVKDVALEIFYKVVGNGVCACTLCDVVIDLIC